MDSEDRDYDKKHFFAKPNSSSKKLISLDQIKSLYIASGMEAEEIAQNTFLDVNKVKDLIEEHKLPELRQAYIRQGVANLQNQQVHQAQKLMDLEVNFKKLRIIQLEKELEEFVAYYARHGDFFKRHPVSGEIIKDQDGIRLQIKVPNVSKEIFQLKESVTLSEGLKQLLTKLDDILHKPKQKEKVDASGDNVIDLEVYDAVFTRK